MKIYFDFNDWWIGYYKGSSYHFICPLPTLVFRWENRQNKKLRNAFQEALKQPLQMQFITNPVIPKNTAIVFDHQLLHDIMQTVKHSSYKTIAIRPETAEALRKIQEESTE